MLYILVLDKKKVRLKKEKEEKEHKKKEKAEAHLYTIIKVSGSTFLGYLQVVFYFFMPT